ncbi:mobile mystery protein B [Hyphomicrobium sp. CS1BSMeth3]|jgi:Fic-DOC domain mobile mystery protein B|uniref:mobile mystery protein B n=1 Tax=Hyphomicrobium sp. CS1BSMeth3 TaxID=1892844 RepID=UPI000931C570|nr:mobile mystery protein B [Hyphomicrobium sp. CS1BSMeth3]
MADNLFEQPNNATPLRPEEVHALRVPVVDRRQLNEIEALNVTEGRAWALRSRRDHLTDSYLTELHRRMFGTVWTWAGAYRAHEVNIGNVPPHEVPVRVRAALDDARYWAEHETYGAHELAIRLHHRLVLVHPFVNGNGRCTRAMADIVVHRMKAAPLTWGSTSLIDTGAARAAYIAALKRADDHDFEALIAFATS